MTDPWSSTPISVDGITIEPKRPISPEYRRHVERSTRAQFRTDRTPEDVERDFLAHRRETFEGDCDHPDEHRARLGCARCGEMWEKDSCP